MPTHPTHTNPNPTDHARVYRFNDRIAVSLIRTNAQIPASPEHTPCHYLDPREALTLAHLLTAAALDTLYGPPYSQSTLTTANTYPKEPPRSPNPCTPPPQQSQPHPPTSP